MKIPYYKYPLVEHKTRQEGLNNDLFRMALYSKLMKSEYDRGYFAEYRKFIDELADTKDLKTYLIAETVSNYLFQHAEPIMNKLWDFIPEMKEQTGCILWRDWTYFFKKFDDEGQGVIMYFIAQGVQGEVGVIIKEPEVKGMVRGNPPDETKAKGVGFMLSGLFLPFLEFAESETKIINAKTGHRAKIGKEKYVTDIPYDIEIVDSNWFTTSIRTEGFGVTGHFRLQPVGEARQGRKLIWIADFQKHGYTKRAKVDITAEKGIDK
jgi:hypothetical protein